jgi:hypothetical protein
MAFADPQTLTINSVANTLPRTSSGESRGVFTKDDGTVRLTISSTTGKRVRNSARVDFQKTSPDPLTPATYRNYSISVSLTVDSPLSGFSITEKKQIVDALTAWATASTGARTTQMLGGES